MAIPNGNLEGDRQYDVVPDGSQFVIVTRASEGENSPVHLILNCPALLKR